MAANGFGNGSSVATNNVKLSPLYHQCCAEIQAKRPALDQAFFNQIPAAMVVCDVSYHATYLGGFTYFMQTPDEVEPRLLIYFTYAASTIVVQAVHLYE